MPIETAPFIGSLVPSNPLDTDQESQGAAQIRLVKSAVQASFPNVNGAVGATDVQLTQAGGAYQIDGYYAPLPVGNTTDGNQGGQLLLQTAGAAGALQGYLETYDNQVTIGLQTPAVLTSTNATNTITGSVTVSQTLTTAAAPVATMWLDAGGNVHTSITGTPTGLGASFFANGTALSFVGEVRMFYGSPAFIPRGWAVCDGTQGTPDMRGVFPVGADLGSGSSYPVGYAGGAAFPTLSVAQLPVHNHPVIDYGHTHGVSDHGHTHGVSDPGHDHTAANIQVHNGSGVNVDNGAGATSSQTVTTSLATTGIAIAPADTGVTVEPAGCGIDIGNTGQGVPLDNRPPFRSLIFIMRIA